MVDYWLNWALDAQANGIDVPVILSTLASGPGRPHFIFDNQIVEPLSNDRPQGLVPSEQLGPIHEALLASHDRRSRGVFYTPEDVASGLVKTVINEECSGSVVDPSCGAGMFLIAAGRRLVDLGFASPELIAKEWLFGADTSPVAVAVARWSIAEWSGVASEDLSGIVVGDPLIDGLSVWSRKKEFGFDAVVGNPPFLGQLRLATARDSVEREKLSELYEGLVRPYTDTSWLFLACGMKLLTDRGQMVLIQPQSMLSARDAEPVRNYLLEEGRLAGLWFDTSKVFAGHSEVCAPVIRKDDSREVVQLFTDREVVPAHSVSQPDLGTVWGPVVSGLIGIPETEISMEVTVAEEAAVTAGFRQHFYGLIPLVAEKEDISEKESIRPLITTAMIEPLLCRWGTVPTRFAGSLWKSPIINEELISTVNSEVVTWLNVRQRPKLLVATQTLVIEVVVDVDGSMVPTTPIIIVEPKRDLWMLAAALSAPPITALAASTTLGAARSAGRIKLTAQQVADLPLPRDVDAWKEGAVFAFRLWEAGVEASVDEWWNFGEIMCEAYQVNTEKVMDWWWERHPATKNR